MSLAALVGLVMVLTGVVIGVHPLGDNSFLTHLATGRIIWDTHAVPTHDVYTFTVPGHDWVVQSWLASLLFAAADHIGGLRAVMLFFGVVTTALTFILWQLTKPARTLIPRVVVAALPISVGAGFWTERPLLLGLVAFGVALLAAEGRIRPQWLVLTMWLWVNVHGSFPLGLVALAALYAGRRLDKEDASIEQAALKWAAIGTALAAINPLGPRLLLFPIELLRRQDILQYIVEWQAPRFTSLDERFFLLEVMVAIALLVRRPRWRTALPLVIFLAAALFGARNVVTASLVLAPGLAAGLADLGSLDGSERRFIYRPVAFVMCAGAALIALSQLNTPLLKLNSHFPVDAITHAEALGLVGPGHRLIAQDVVGNYLEGRYGTSASVFIDDRYDMHPKSLVVDYADLLGGRPNWAEILDRHQAEAVLWEPKLPLASLLLESPDWRVVYADKSWLLFVRTTRP
jgi:hypothetical protein